MIYIGAGRLGGDDDGVLRHVARPVHLAIVVDLDFAVDFAGDRSETAEFYKNKNDLKKSKNKFEFFESVNFPILKNNE